VLVNGWRRHQMAVLNTFAYGMGAGSSGVDLNALLAARLIASKCCAMVRPRSTGRTRSRVW